MTARKKDQIVDNTTPEERKIISRKRLAYFVIAIDIILLIFVVIEAVILISELLS